MAYVWAELYKQFDIHIDFAHRTFVWGSEAKLKAAVHCVIIGFSTSMSKENVVCMIMERLKKRYKLVRT